MAKTTTSSGGRNASWRIVLGVLLALSLAGNGFLLWQYTEKQEELEQANKTIDLFKADPESAQQASVEQYVKQVALVYDLPEDETPSVATVRDQELLAEQPFFERAENGDVVLIYPDAELAILYRPATGQLVNVSSLTIDDESEGFELQEGQVEAGSSGLDTE